MTGPNQRGWLILAALRAAVLGTSLALAVAAAAAATAKPFQRDDLTDSAVKLEAQIKHEAGRGKVDRRPQT